LHKYLCTETGVLKKKLAIWDSFVQKGDTEVFSTLNEFCQVLMSLLKSY